MAEGLDWCWRFIPELFEVDELLEGLIARGIRLAGSVRFDCAGSRRIPWHIDRRQRRHQMCFTSSGMS
jgi:hypothetical protein